MNNENQYVCPECGQIHSDEENILDLSLLIEEILGRALSMGSHPDPDLKKKLAAEKQALADKVARPDDPENVDEFGLRKFFVLGLERAAEIGRGFLSAEVN